MTIFPFSLQFDWDHINAGSEVLTNAMEEDTGSFLQGWL